MKRIMLASCILALAACDNGGPTEKDIEGILPGTKVSLRACSKVGDTSFRCRFLVNNPTGPMQEGEQSYCFTGSGGAWTMTMVGC